MRTPTSITIAVAMTAIAFTGMGAVLPDAREAISFAAAELEKSFAGTRATSGRRPRQR